MEQLSKETLFKYKKELEYYSRQRKKFLIIGLILLGLDLISLIVLIVLLATQTSLIASVLLIYPIIFLSIGALVVFILRSALYNARINN